MRHRRRAITPTVRAAGRATLGVAAFVFLVAVLNSTFRGAGPDWTVFAIPVGVALVIGGFEVAWVLGNAPRTIVADETGLEVHRRDGRTETLAWTDLASIRRATFSGTVTFRRRDGSTLRLSPLGVPAEDWKELGARAADVLEGGGPPLPVEGEPVAAAPEAPIPETPAALFSVLAGAFGGAVLGAGAWGLLSGFTGFEVGYVAIGVGFLVGGGAARLGGRGAATGAACAVVALFAMLAGKGLGFGIALEREIRKQQDSVGRDTYDLIERNAADWAAGVPPAQVPRYMATHGFSDSEIERDVTKEEIEAFRATSVPFLESWHRLPPRFEAWQESTRANIREVIREQVSFLRGIGESLGPLDILFAFLGASTAFRLGRGQVAGAGSVPGARRARKERTGEEKGRTFPGKGAFPKKTLGPPASGTPGPPRPGAGPPPGSDPPAPRS